MPLRGTINGLVRRGDHGKNNSQTLQAWKLGESHTSFENLKKGFNQRDLGKKGLKRVDRVGERMIKSGLLHSKQTRYGLEVSLEFTAKDELAKIVKRVFSDDEFA